MGQEQERPWRDLTENDVLPKVYQYRSKVGKLMCGEWTDGDPRNAGVMLTDIHLDTSDYRVPLNIGGKSGV